jgi:hypothetical protein
VCVKLLCPCFTLFTRMCTTTPYLSSAKACTITMGSDTSPHVLRYIHRFFDHSGASAAAWSMPLPHATLRPDGEVSGSGVSEGVTVSEAPTFMEWSTMVVPTYPEGGSHALQVCHSTTIRLCESATLSGWVRARERNTLLATAPADLAETFTVARRTVCAVRP